MSRAELTSGTVELCVTPARNFVVAQAQVGREWHTSYRYKITRKDSEQGTTFFLSSLTEGKKGDRWVYVGVVHGKLGTLRLTAKSAFPEHATRVQVARRVLTRMFAGETAVVEQAGWKVDCRVLEEVARF